MPHLFKHSTASLIVACGAALATSSAFAAAGNTDAPERAQEATQADDDARSATGDADQLREGDSPAMEAGNANAADRARTATDAKHSKDKHAGHDHAKHDHADHTHGKTTNTVDSESPALVPGNTNAAERARTATDDQAHAAKHSGEAGMNDRESPALNPGNTNATERARIATDSAEANNATYATGRTEPARTKAASCCKASDKMASFVKVNTAVAYLEPTEGNQANGTITLTETAEGLRITADIAGLDPNAKHAIHIHEFGNVSSSDGTAAGSHYNPSGHDHALADTKQGHAGDLGNLEADAEGHATFSFLAKNLSIASAENPVLGRSIIVHAEPDDGGQPTGNAGARIAQGVIGVAAQ